VWDHLKGLYAKGYYETLKYKEKTGNPNAPIKYITPDGFKLGAWQTNRRSAYKTGKLSTDRIKMLEEIGFKWELKK
jgi:hypothetical protein